MKSRHTLPAPRRFMRHGLVPQLAAFEAVMRLGSAVRAAESLCVAQSTLSGHLRKLSDALGVQLFDLQGKQLVPTPAAQALIASVDEVFDAFTRCEQALEPLRPERRAGSECRDDVVSWSPSPF